MIHYPTAEEITKKTEDTFSKRMLDLKNSGKEIIRENGKKILYDKDWIWYEESPKSFYANYGLLN